ncbi:MAG: aldolase [Rhodospirillales bacterium]|nr:aldolase [Rhodospirillales bacterium]
MLPVRNLTKQKLAEGKLVLGFLVHHLRTVAVPLLAAATDHDFLFIDTEHGAFSLQEATQLCLAALSTGVTPLVRVCAGALDEATRLLDNGALGIVVPHVDTAKQARRIAEAFHYPPAGTRSWGGPPPAYLYQAPADVAVAQAAINGQVLTVVMLETAEAVANAADIAAVPGIDVLLIGSFDLTTDLGVPGQMGHPKLVAAYEAVAAACRRHGKVLGMGGINGQGDATRYIGMGARFVTNASDHAYVVEGARARTAFLRGVRLEVPAARAPAEKPGRAKKTAKAKATAAG